MSTVQLRRSVLGRRVLSSIVAVLVSACGGGGGSSSDDGGGGGGYSGPVTVSGTATFDSVPSGPTGGLNYAGTTSKPIRGATVQLLGSNGAVLATQTTSDSGAYSFASVAAQQLIVRVRAELKAATHDVTVKDNTSGNALYVLDSAPLRPSEATATVNLSAASGWGGTSYSGTRAAGPFAILDVAWQVKEKVLAVAPNDPLPALTVYWSPNNRPSDVDNFPVGDIGTSFFIVDRALGNTIYLLGAADTDTDEYDSAVVAHEMGHYLEEVRSRADSVGGPHAGDERLDPRVAFSEGWGNAWSSMVRNSPVYSDSMQTRQAGGFAYNLETLPAATTQGWFQEDTVAHLLWKWHQNPDIGFGGLYSALTAMRSQPAFSTLHNFNAQLKNARPGMAPTVAANAAALGVGGSDIYGTGENNNGGLTLTSALPVYNTHNVALGASQQYCVSSDFGTPNKLGNFVYVRFTASGARTLTVSRAAGTTAATDPDVLLVKSDGSSVVGESTAANVEAFTTTLPAGSHVLAINDFNLQTPVASRCFELRIE